jgi:hypothetical protein
MRRREFITVVGGAAGSLAWPRQARAQQQQRTTKPARIGVLASFHHPPLQRMLQKLNELGYVEGATVHFEYRFAEGHDDRYPGLGYQGIWVRRPVRIGLHRQPQRAIQNGKFFLACFSKEYDERHKAYVSEELHIAIEEIRRLRPDGKQWFIPILINETVIARPAPLLRGTLDRRSLGRARTTHAKANFVSR